MAPLGRRRASPGALARRAIVRTLCPPPPPEDAVMEPLVISSRITLPASDLSWSAARSGGPGGQNVNKVATKVDLRFDLEGTDALPEWVKDRLRQLATRDAEGRVIVVSSETRSQATNLEDARERLVELVKRAMQRPKRRKRTKPSRGAKRRRLEAKRRNAEKKKRRGKVDW